VTVVTAVTLVAGLALLIGGAELLVRGASRLATLAGISPLVVGLTVVAYGTSAPELAVSVRSALAGQADLAVGNVVGSNIFNVLVILGLSAVITPLVVRRQLVRVDVPLMIGASVLLLLLASDGRIGRGDGLVLAGGAIVYTLLALRMGRTAAASDGAAEEGPLRRGAAVVAGHLALVGAGLAMLVVGARWLVDAAVVVARAAGLSELIIGLTLVAAGTSLPEVATSVVAALRGERDIAVGNVVGSNLFNILTVLGATAIVAPAGVAVAAPALRFDLPVMLLVAVACLPIFFTGHRIDRWEGALFLGYYVAYVAFLVLDATDHDLAGPFGLAVLAFAGPITAVTLAVLAFRALRRGGEGPLGS
jgi:cation:H+ antiporter